VESRGQRLHHALVEMIIYNKRDRETACGTQCALIYFLLASFLFRDPSRVIARKTRGDTSDIRDARL
jgi:hypothetical protein